MRRRLHPGSRAFAVVLVSSGFLQALLADEAAVRLDLDAALGRYERLFAQSFELPFKSTEISAFITRMVAEATQKSVGFPLQVNVSHFTYTRQGKTRAIAAHLADLPPQQKAQMEQQANQLLAGTDAARILQGIAFDALQEGISYLQTERKDCQVKQETAETADVMVLGAKQQIMPGLELRESWFRLDRKAKTITGINFVFTNGANMLVRLRYRDLALPGGTPVPVPAEMLIKQNALETVDGQKLPSKITVQYCTCTLKPAP